MGYNWIIKFIKNCNNLPKTQTIIIFWTSVASMWSRSFVLFCVFVFGRATLSWCLKTWHCLQCSFFEHFFKWYQGNITVTFKHCTWPTGHIKFCLDFIHFKQLCLLLDLIELKYIPKKYLGYYCILNKVLFRWYK